VVFFFHQINIDFDLLYISASVSVDNVNTNKTLNITVIEKLCGADIIYLYIQQLIKALVSQALNTTGNADDLST